jgi:hypothetical protein
MPGFFTQCAGSDRSCNGTETNSGTTWEASDGGVQSLHCLACSNVFINKSPSEEIMFERYTEKARRAIFFARYEASQFGRGYIETEHLLLGLLREDTALAGRLSRSPLSPEDLRKRIEDELPQGKSISTSIDMPLSAAAKATLASAAEEAERFGHQHIGTEHLLLGILRQENTLAGKLLMEAGLKIRKIRDDISRSEHHPGRPAKPVPEWNQDYVEIHGEMWSFPSVREFSEHYRKFCWEKRRWSPRDALAQRSDKKLLLYSGQTFDRDQMELVKGGWKEDHCVICWWKLDDSPEHRDCYTNGQDWLCRECYERFVTPPSPAAP